MVNPESLMGFYVPSGRGSALGRGKGGAGKCFWGEKRLEYRAGPATTVTQSWVSGGRWIRDRRNTTLEVRGNTSLVRGSLVTGGKLLRLLL